MRHAIRAAAVCATLGWAVVGCSGEDAAGPDERLLTSPGAFVPRARDQVDILIVMDNSGSMSQEQAAFARYFPLVVEQLFDPPDEDGDGRPDAPPIASLNIGVTSTDLGTGGYRVSTCSNSDVGDDGCFLHDPSPLVADCEPSYPAFLTRDRWATLYPVERFALDVTCIGTLGTTGCGWEQQLEAARRAVGSNLRPGRCNEGFLRPDSVLVVLWVSDEQDMSVLPDHPEMFNPDLGELGHLSIRAFLHPNLLVPVDEYVAAFGDLRPGDPDDVLLGMIIGTPPEVPACTGRGDELAGCLDSPQMYEEINPANPTNLTPSCNTSMGIAYPPTRFVELAEMWGRWAWVASICQEDWTAPMEGLRRMIGERVLGWICGPEAPFDAPMCTVPGCWAVETLIDDAPCPEDPACPAEWCPPLELAGLLENDPSPCVAPDSGSACRPLHRDLGTFETPWGEPHRRCLVRQATRTYDPAADRCGEPLDEGWTWSPEAWGEHGCPEVALTPELQGSVPSGATIELRCRPGG